MLPLGVVRGRGSGAAVTVAGLFAIGAYGLRLAVRAGFGIRHEKRRDAQCAEKHYGKDKSFDSHGKFLIF
jgi:hypothetical protein